MGLEGGIPTWLLLGHAYRQIDLDPAFTDAVHDEAMEMVFFTVRGGPGVERRYRLTIERGAPVVVQVEGPPETAR